MRDEKQLLLDEIKEKIEGANALVLTRYRSLTPDKSADFRQLIGETGGAFTVVKKRLLLKAVEEIGISLDPSILEGQIGVLVGGEDAVSTTKALFKFASDHKNLFEVLGGHFEGQLCNAKDIEAISKLPSQDEMRAQFLGLLEAPMAQTLSVVEALLASVMHCLENKSQQESK